MNWHAGVKTEFRTTALVGAAALLLGFGGFGAWAAIAPLEGAIMASGTVTVSGQNKVVQHLEGGIIDEILVREGDRIAAGGPVLILDGTAAEALRNRLTKQLNTLAALEARSLAERDGAAAVQFPEELVTAADDLDIANLMADQEAEFQARFERHRAELQILAQQIAARGEEITGLAAQKAAAEAQIELLTEQKDDYEKLLRESLIEKSRLVELRGRLAELQGEAGAFAASIAKARQSIAETEQEIERQRFARSEEAIAKLTEVRLQRADSLEQLRTAQETLDRVVLRAPVGGTVMNLAKHNAGAIVGPGQDIMEIVPDAVELIVEARIRLQDIDDVRVGQTARLTFAALDQRHTPSVPGEVVHVSADSLQDERTGDDFYLARLAISTDAIDGFDRSRIGAGHPVDVFIATSERTFLAYLTEPITSTFGRAVREN